MNNFFSPEALYINWPDMSPALQQRYFHALRLEIERFARLASAQKTVRSIFIADQSNGFLPECLLDTPGILRIMTVEKAEISVAVTQLISDEQLGMWRQAGVNRLNSVIRERMNSSWLEYLQRAVRVFESTAVDLWMNYPDMLTAEWKAQLDAVLLVPIKHISIYFDEHDGSISDAEVGDRYIWTVASLQKAGFEQYSAYDFALPGYQSEQQRVYFGYRPYKGFGVGACSFASSLDRAARYQTTNEVTEYCIAQESGIATGWFTVEQLTESQKRFERIMLSLSSYGVQLEEVVKGQSDAWVKHFFDVITPLCDAGLTRMQEGILSLTPRGRLVENEIIIKISWI